MAWRYNILWGYSLHGCLVAGCSYTLACYTSIHPSHSGPLSLAIPAWVEARVLVMIAASDGAETAISAK